MGCYWELNAPFLFCHQSNIMKEWAFRDPITDHVIYTGDWKQMHSVWWEKTLRKESHSTLESAQEWERDKAIKKTETNQYWTLSLCPIPNWTLNTHCTVNTVRDTETRCLVMWHTQAYTSMHVGCTHKPLLTQKASHGRKSPHPLSYTQPPLQTAGHIHKHMHKPKIKHTVKSGAASWFRAAAFATLVLIWWTKRWPCKPLSQPDRHKTQRDRVVLALCFLRCNTDDLITPDSTKHCHRQSATHTHRKHTLHVRDKSWELLPTPTHTHTEKDRQRRHPGNHGNPPPPHTVTSQVLHHDRYKGWERRGGKRSPEMLFISSAGWKGHRWTDRRDDDGGRWRRWRWWLRGWDDEGDGGGLRIE